LGMATGDTADVDERYAVAINARSLKVDDHKSGPVDVLAAAAWSPTRIGAQLLRLSSEFDSGQRAKTKTDAVLLWERLKSLEGAQEQLTLYAVTHGMESPAVKARAALLWWLDHVCPKCQGRKWLPVRGTPHLSGVLCPPRHGCGGSGETTIPHGAEGRKLSVFIDDCVNRARSSIRHRLRGK
jgi:hypothetical protein